MCFSAELPKPSIAMLGSSFLPDSGSFRAWSPAGSEWKPSSSTTGLSFHPSLKTASDEYFTGNRFSRQYRRKPGNAVETA
jgi:hypothetical protein